MSGTELGRVMADVTAQPPVDVDFGAVEHLVRRRQRRLQHSAGAAAVAAIVAIVAVPALGGLPGQAHQVHRPGAPTTGNNAFRRDSWNSLTWSVPTDWPASDAYPDHSRPSNAFIDGPYIGSTRVPLSAPTPRPTQGSGVLAAAGPSLPEGAVVGWFSYGLRSDPDAPAAFDADATKYLPGQCAAMGAGQTFHAVRQFGTATAGSNLSLDGCINSADPTVQRQQLAAVLRSVTDSAYPTPAPPLAVPTTAATSPADATAQWTAGGLSWLTPPGWSVSDKDIAPSTVDQVAQQNSQYLSTVALNPSCAQAAAGLRCEGGGPITTLGADDAIAELSVSTFKDIEGDTGQFYPFDNDGGFATSSPQCSGIGGSQLWAWSHLFGSRSNARLVTLSACLGSAAGVNRPAQLLALAESIAVQGFPDLKAGTDHPILLRGPASSAAPASPTGVAAGTTAAALCSSALGTWATAEITTVGEIRTATWGPQLPNGKGPLAAAFPAAAANAPAAWCWTLPSRNVADDYVVHAGDKALLAISINGDDDSSGPLPHGQPTVP